MEQQCADEVLGNERFVNNVIRRIQDHQDILLAKLIRNLSKRTYEIQMDLILKNENENKNENETETMSDSTIQSYFLKKYWDKRVLTLMDICISCENHDLLIELIGTLSNMSIYDLPTDVSWSDIMSQYALGTLIGKLFIPGMAQNDIILEAIIFIGQICVDDQIAWLLSTNRILHAVTDIWVKRENELEMNIQILNVFHKFLSYSETREELLNNSGKLNNNIKIMSFF